MQLGGPWRLMLVAILAGLTVLSQPQVGAQTVELDSQTRAQLAAIPLTAGELPDGFRLVGERFQTAEEASFANVDPQALTEAGLLGLYTSVYRQPGGADSIIAYATAWTDAAAAEAGFAIIEDEAVTDPDGGMSDAPLDAGAGSAEITTGTVDDNGATLNLTDATFVIDRFVVGVVVRAAPENPIDQAGVMTIVDSLESRANAVVSGQAPAGTDLGLPASVIDVRPLGVEQQAGFLSAGESEALYGLSGSSLGGIQTSWVSSVAASEGATAPFIAVAVSTFENPENVARVVEQSADLVPLTVELQPVDGFAVDGVNAVRGYRYASPASPDPATPDSFRAVAQIDTRLVVVDVQGATSVDQAQTAATELLAAQVRCAGGDCQLPEVNLG